MTVIQRYREKVQEGFLAWQWLSASLKGTLSLVKHPKPYTLAILLGGWRGYLCAAETTEQPMPTLLVSDVMCPRDLRNEDVRRE
jgi:hypothetical protein